MDNLIDTVASTMYEADAPVAPWFMALPEDRKFYTGVAEVVVDTIVDYLKSKDAEFGGLSAAIEYISLSTEAARLRRMAAQP